MRERGERTLVHYYYKEQKLDRKRETKRERVLKEAREEIASLVVQTASKVLSKDLSEDEKHKFASRATDELNLSV